MKARLRIMIADDNDEIREVLGSVLQAQQAMAVISEARTGHEAVALARDQKPDLVLMDVEMPRLDGFQALQRIVQDRADSKVIMVTRKTSRAAVNRAKQLGARGYVAKRDLHAELGTAIQAITEGRSYLSKSVGGTPSRACSSGADAAKQVRATRSQGGDIVPSHSQKGRFDTHGNEETHIHNPIRVFLVDDEGMVGTVVSQMLQNDSRFQFVGVGHDEETVVKVMADEQPDIVLLDIYLGDHKRGGWGMMKRIHQGWPHAGIIVFTRSTGRANVQEAWKQEAAGYLNKGNWEEEGIRAMLSVYAGERFFPMLGAPHRNRQSPTKDLSGSQREVYDRYVRDVLPQAIAEEMSIEVDTVYVHMENIRAKIGHQDGWRGISRRAQRDRTPCSELSDTEQQVCDLYVQGTIVSRDIATQMGCSEAEVIELIRSIRRKLNCHPDGWKGIAREEGDID